MRTRAINGVAIRVIREALGLRNGDLARRANISPAFLSRIEQGARKPSAKVAVALAEGLGVPLEAITYPVATQPIHLKATA